MVIIVPLTCFPDCTMGIGSVLQHQVTSPAVEIPRSRSFLILQNIWDSICHSHREKNNVAFLLYEGIQ